MTDPMCICDKEAEATLHYFLRCNLYSFCRTELLNDIQANDSSTKNYSEKKHLNTRLYGSLDFNNDKKNKILKQTINQNKLNKV